MSGQNFNQKLVVAASPNEVSLNVLASTAGVRGYTATMAGPGSIALTRKVTPTWAKIIAIIFFPIGFLALLDKQPEVTMVTITPVAGGSRVTVSGLGSLEMFSRLTGALKSLPAVGADPGGQPNPLGT